MITASTSRTLIWRLAGTALLLLFSLQFAAAQNEDNWGDEEEEETEVAATEPAAKRAEILIRINGEEVKLTGEYAVDRNDTLDIQVRYLAPSTPVIIEIKKGGINFKRKVFYANNKGELDLEVRTGGKKVAGDALVYYTPSGAAKKTLEVKIIVE